MPADVLLLDNGSVKPAATLRLRQLATDLSTRLQQPVEPVSLAHANKIKPELINDKPALLLHDFLEKRLEAGQQDFIILPLFFGHSKAVSSAIPQVVEQLTEKFGSFNCAVAETIYPLPQAEPLLIQLLVSLTNSCIQTSHFRQPRCVLVDHGSPSPAVTAVREHIAQSLNTSLPELDIAQAVMERRSGKEYDFNGMLLADWLQQLPKDQPSEVIVIQLFFLPGRHAGPGGDIEEICQQAMELNPSLKIESTGLVSEHPLLVDILQQRLERMG